MWPCPNKDIPKWQIEEEALRVVREAVQEDDFDPTDNSDFNQALECLSENGAYSKAIWMIQKGIHDGDRQMLYYGLSRLLA